MSTKRESRGDPSEESREAEPVSLGPGPHSPDGPDLAAKPKRLVKGSDPYNHGKDGQAVPGEAVTRRSLDDMRRLSEAIRTAPNWTPPKKAASGALYQRLDLLRAELERVLAEINSLREGGGRDVPHHARELMVQLRDAAHHLGEAIANLVPPGN